MTTIILTSTVNVNLKKSCLFQKDSDSRLAIYLKSITQWLEKTNFNIVLVDNSGYNYDELSDEKEKYKHRFEVVVFTESEIDQAKYLKNNESKGASEIFAINYAFWHSTLIHSSNFIIKITARFFINELEEYLKQFDLNKYDCLTQQNRDRCEMVGSHYRLFSHIFNFRLFDDNLQYDSHIENVWKLRTSKCNKILICKKFDIEKTQRGGVDYCYDTI
jgi:hypothetical protein